MVRGGIDRKLSPPHSPSRAHAGSPGSPPRTRPCPPRRRGRRRTPLAVAPSRPPVASWIRSRTAATPNGLAAVARCRCRAQPPPPPFFHAPRRGRPAHRAHQQVSLTLRHRAAPLLAAEESFSWFHHFGPSPALLLCLRPPMDDPTWLTRFFINPFLSLQNYHSRGKYRSFSENH